MRECCFNSRGIIIHTLWNVAINRKTPALIGIHRIRPLVNGIFPICNGFEESSPANSHCGLSFSFLFVVIRVPDRHKSEHRRRKHDGRAHPLALREGYFRPERWIIIPVRVSKTDRDLRIDPNTVINIDT